MTVPRGELEQIRGVRDIRRRLRRVRAGQDRLVVAPLPVEIDQVRGRALQTGRDLDTRVLEALVKSVEVPGPAGPTDPARAPCRLQIGIAGVVRIAVAVVPLPVVILAQKAAGRQPLDGIVDEAVGPDEAVHQRPLVRHRFRLGRAGALRRAIEDNLADRRAGCRKRQLQIPRRDVCRFGDPLVIAVQFIDEQRLPRVTVPPCDGRTLPVARHVVEADVTERVCHAQIDHDTQRIVQVLMHPPIGIARLRLPRLPRPRGSPPTSCSSTNSTAALCPARLISIPESSRTRSPPDTRPHPAGPDQHRHENDLHHTQPVQSINHQTNLPIPLRIADFKLRISPRLYQVA